MYKFEDYRLGRTDTSITVSLREENQTAMLKMVQQCRQNLEIISRDLEPALYDESEFIDAVKDMVLANKHARVRILVCEPQKIVAYGHRLLNLATRLSSFFEIRKPPPEFSDYNESLFMADRCGYLHRKNAARYEGLVNFNDKKRCKSFLGQFDLMWEKSIPDANLRKFLI